MVLLSFFVLFFSYGEKEKETKDSITRMVRRFETVTAPVEGSATTVAQAPLVASAPKAEPVAEKLTLSQQLLNVLPANRIQANLDGDSIVLRFGLNAYAPGQVRPPTAVQPQLNQLADILKPFLDEVDIVVVGHADKQKVRRHRKRFNDNLEISLARSVRAVRYLEKQGIPLEKMRSLGTGDQEIASRTISIILKPKMKAQPHSNLERILKDDQDSATAYIPAPKKTEQESVTYFTEPSITDPIHLGAASSIRHFTEVPIADLVMPDPKEAQP
jgi:outer membrane protein OmpA-like peptidoglycan-associated protein